VAQSWNEAYAPLPVLGGLASGDPSAQQTQLYLNGEVFEEGGVAISVGGEVRLQGMISQGCTPIGETWTLTKVEQNLIHEIANRPAYEVLAETFNHLSAEDQKKSRGNLFIRPGGERIPGGLSSRGFSGAATGGRGPADGNDRGGGVAADGTDHPVPKTRRDGGHGDMTVLLARAREQLAGAKVYGGCLCSCNGRGQGLFGVPSHDAQMIQEQLGPFGLAGFFWQRRNRAGGRTEFPARLHGIAGVVREENRLMRQPG